MANKKIWLGILVMVLVFGMAVVGCKTDVEANTADTWADVTSLTQLNGTWKGSYTQTTPPQSQGGITTEQTVETTMTIVATNANTGTMSGSMKGTITFSGSNINTSWSDIKQSFQSGPGVAVFNDANHSITITQNISSQQISLSDVNGFQINQNGTKFKQPTSEDGSVPEIILTKQ